MCDGVCEVVCKGVCEGVCERICVACGKKRWRLPLFKVK